MIETLQTLSWGTNKALALLENIIFGSKSYEFTIWKHFYRKRLSLEQNGIHFYLQMFYLAQKVITLLKEYKINLWKHFTLDQRPYSHVRPFYEQAESDLDPKRSMHRPV